MSWINTISYQNAKGKLKSIYARVAGPNNKVDNILLAHSLRPHTLEGHMQLYKNVLHHSANQLDKHWLEAIGVYVSMINHCSYCVDHHYQGYKRLLNDDTAAEKMYTAMKNDNLNAVFNPKYLCLFRYAKKLTLTPRLIEPSDLEDIRNCDFDDGIILEINQVIAYFNYANRTVLGLGVSIENNNVGLSPNKNNDPDNWSHD